MDNVPAVPAARQGIPFGGPVRDMGRPLTGLGARPVDSGGDVCPTGGGRGFPVQAPDPCTGQGVTSPVAARPGIFYLVRQPTNHE